MSTRALELAARLIRNFNEVPMERETREPLYDTHCARLARGTLRVAGEHLPIKTGDVIFIPAGPEYPHQIINTSAARLKYLSIGTRESPEIAEYPDSGKFLAYTSGGQGRQFQVIGRPGQDLDYWDGEP